MGSRFTVLVGSCARGQAAATSDVDVVRICHADPVVLDDMPEVAVAGGPISTVDYDEQAFARLRESGSLFLYHVLTEGVLVDGCESAWSGIVEGFVVQTDFSREIREYCELYRWLRQPQAFAKAECQLLSHTFRALKNLAIFALAERGEYIFDKRGAIAGLLPRLPARDIDLMLNANQAHERGAPEFSALPEETTELALSRLFSRIDSEIAVAGIA